MHFKDCSVWWERNSARLLELLLLLFAEVCPLRPKNGYYKTILNMCFIIFLRVLGVVTVLPLQLPFHQESTSRGPLVTSVVERGT
jgi:hypothetical protein